MGFHKFIRHFGSTTSTHDRAALVEGQLLDTNQQETSHATTDWHSRLAFFVFGLANNFPFVVMLSAAEDILARNSPNLSTGVVLLADVLPDLLVKATLPFVMQGWSFKLRVTLVALFNAIGFITVALSNATWLSLLGVAAASLSSALGDITFLSLTSFYSKSTISFWSSGTGAAGFLGSLCYLALSVIMSPSAALLAMLVGPVMMLICYFCVLKHPSISSHATSPTSSSHLDSITLHSVTVDTQTGDVSTQSLLPVGNTHDARATSVSPDDHEIDADQGIEHRKRSVLGQISLLKPLLPYMIPLLMVYFSAYVINQGIFENVYWNGIFISKITQYRAFQTLYRFGVFVSRSSGSIFPVKRVWIPAALECANLLLLALDARFQVLPSIWMWFVIIVYEGLLAGSTYVNSFLLVSQASDDQHREFCMGIASVAGSVGITMAGGAAIGISAGLRSVGPR